MGRSPNLHRYLIFVLALCLTFSCYAATSEKAVFGIPDGGFERNGIQGWIPESLNPAFTYSIVKGEAHGGQSFLTINGSKEGDETFSLAKMVSGPLPVFKYVKLTGYVRTTGDARITLQAMAGGNPLGRKAFVAKDAVPPKDGKWNRMEVKYHVPMGTDGLKVICNLKGKGTASFDDLKIEEIAHEPDIRVHTPGPGIATAQGAADYKASKDVDKFEVVFPLPIVNSYQTPISFQISVDPPEKLISSEIFHRAGVNWNCRVVLGPFKKDEVVKLRYWSDVILAAADFSKIPEKVTIPPRGEYPKDVLPWLEPTFAVQSNHPRIMSKMMELKEASGEDAIAYIKGALAFKKTIGFKKPMGVDAVETLQEGGACTSCANLVAALCRAAGIPARVMANYIVWNTPFQTHYVIEVYLQGVGWVPCESIQLIFPWDPFNAIFMSSVEIQDEMDSFEENRYAAGGVPKWSLNESDTRSGIEMINAPLGQLMCDHIAYPKAQYPKDAGLSVALEKGRRIWAAYLNAKTGKGKHPALVSAMDKQLTDVPATPQALAEYLSNLEKLIRK